MGCGGSRIVLTGAEKPLDHWMEKLEIDFLDREFTKASEIIKEIELKRVVIIDNLDTIYEKSGCIAFKHRDLEKSLKCCIWKLGVDNDGKGEEIGFNNDTKTFEGNKNSSLGNDAANLLINYCKNIVENLKIEALSENLKDLEDIVKDLSRNIDKNIIDFNKTFENNPFEGYKKSSFLRGNLKKCNESVSCLKDLIQRTATLRVSATAVLKQLNHFSTCNQAIKLEKAYKFQLFHPVQIAWYIIEKIEDKYHIKWDKCVRDHYLKIEIRNKIIAKFVNIIK